MATQQLLSSPRPTDPSTHSYIMNNSLRKESRSRLSNFYASGKQEDTLKRAGGVGQNLVLKPLVAGWQLGGAKGLDPTSGAPAFVAAAQRTHARPLMSSGVCTHGCNGMAENKETVKNWLSSQGSVWREERERASLSPPWKRYARLL